MSLASGGPYTPQRNWNNIPDLLRTMSVKVSIKDGKILVTLLVTEFNRENY